MLDESDLDSNKSHETSFKKRYGYKLMTNLVSFAVGIVSQSIVLRGLGPASYGDFSYLTSFFKQVIGFLSWNSSPGFYTKLSQRQNEKGLISFYYFFVFLFGLVLSLSVAVCFASGFNEHLWPGQITSFVIMAALWAFLKFNSDVLILISDAFGLTVKSEIINVLLKLFGLVVILLLFWKGWFSLKNYFLFCLFALILTIFSLVWVVKADRSMFLTNWQLKKDEVKSYTKEFVGFCLPLVLLASISMVEVVIDRWLLQKFSGSIQQGYYGMAYQVGTICFLFVSAMIPLVMREYAISFGKNDINELRRLFLRFLPMLYAIASYFGCFIAIESDKVILLFGGQAYSAAILPITIMAFFPIHQAYGQLNASFFIATNRTKVYRNIGIIFALIGLPIAVFLLGPKAYGGLQAGATGLAIKILLINILAVNVQLWFNLKLLNLPFWKFFCHQILVVMVFLFMAWICSFTVGKVISNYNFLFQFFLSGFAYTLLSIVLLLIYPRFFAVREEEIISFGTKIKKMIKSKI